MIQQKPIESALEILPGIKPTSINQRKIFAKTKILSSGIPQTQVEDQPLFLELFLGVGCNLRCIYCFTTERQCAHNSKDLTQNEYKSIIDQVLTLGVKKVIFVGRGEPFMSDLIWSLLKYIERKGMCSIVLTNATLITPEIAQRLYKMKCYVIPKINSFNSEIQDELVGVHGAAGKMYRGVHNLMESGFNKPSRLGQTRLMNNNLLCSLNYKEFSAIIQWCISHNICPYVERIQWKGRAVDNRYKLQLTEEQLNQVSRDLTRIQEEGWLWPTAPYLDGELCLMEKMPLFINEKGDVVFCWMREDLVIGNIRNSSLKELWRSEHFVQIRRQHYQTRALIAKGLIMPDECPGREYARNILIEKGITIERMNRRIQQVNS